MELPQLVVGGGDARHEEVGPGVRRVDTGKGAVQCRADFGGSVAVGAGQHRVVWEVLDVNGLRYLAFTKRDLDGVDDDALGHSQGSQVLRSTYRLP